MGTPEQSASTSPASGGLREGSRNKICNENPWILRTFVQIMSGAISPLLTRRCYARTCEPAFVLGAIGRGRGENLAMPQFASNAVAELTLHGGNALLLLGDALLYFAVLAALFRARYRIGIGAFFCALGVMHFLETYLASILYVPLPFGIVASPGSAVLFTGKLMMLLLVYIREDAVVVRQPIYGLLIGNLLLFALAFLMRQHGAAPLSADRLADYNFLDEMGALMVWGTLILFADCIMMILLYERSRSFLRDHMLARLAFTGVVVLSFDQGAFYAGLHYLTGAPLAVLFGGWAAKMAAVAIYSLLGALYLVVLERPSRRQRRTPRLLDVFDLLTYRERYEDLVARSGRDALTGALDRGRLETLGRQKIEDAALAGRPISLLIVDIDHFKSFNDRFGHAAGDIVLLRIARIVIKTAGAGDAVFRYGGEEFVVIADDMTRAAALALGERIRRDVASHMEADTPLVTVSVGLATCADDASDYDGLFRCADRRLYLAKSAGRNRVVGETTPDTGRKADPAHPIALAG
jgi:diguanylate cyclase (GGDEF)-like protein